MMIPSDTPISVLSGLKYEIGAFLRGNTYWCRHRDRGPWFLVEFSPSLRFVDFDFDVDDIDDHEMNLTDVHEALILAEADAAAAAAAAAGGDR